VVALAFDDDASSRIYAHASIAEHEEWEDQPLRDAVAVTDVLLRTTPSGVPVIPAAPALEPPNLDAAAATSDETDALLDTMDLSDVLPAPSLREPDAAQLLSLEPTPSGGVDFGVDFDLDLAFDEPPTPDLAALGELDVLEFAPPLSVEPLVADSPPTAAPTAAPPAAAPPDLDGLALDFGVGHGMPDDEAVLEGPPISSPVPDAFDVVPLEPPAPTVVPVTQIVTSGSTRGIAPIADIMQTTPLMNTQPAPAAESSASTAARSPVPAPPARSTDQRRSNERPVRGTAEERVVRAKAAPSGGKGKLIAIIAGVVAVGGGAAAFFLLR
jgi:hypothetical protein